MSTKPDMPKATLEQKRLEALRRQLSGKATHMKAYTKQSEPKGTFSFSSSTPSHSNTKADTAYLRGDLLKTLILSSLAIASELSLYFLTRNHSFTLGSLHF